MVTFNFILLSTVFLFYFSTILEGFKPIYAPRITLHEKENECPFILDRYVSPVLPGAVACISFDAVSG
jgi:hypothetical protein